MSGSAIGANTASLAPAGTRGKATGSGSKLVSATVPPTSRNSSSWLPCPAGVMVSLGPLPSSCTSRFSSRMRDGLPNRAAILPKSMMASKRSATPMRWLVVSIGRGSRLPSLAMIQYGIDCARLSGLVR